MPSGGHGGAGAGAIVSMKRAFGPGPTRVLAVAGSMEVAAIRSTVRRLEEMMPAARAAIVPRGLHTWNWQFPELFSRTVGTG